METSFDILSVDDLYKQVFKLTGVDTNQILIHFILRDTIALLGWKHYLVFGRQLYWISVVVIYC